ncbi:MAG TPA: flagellar motor protein MotB [Sandaracinaceae bacterium LLY-WYZ-13_1]|nr:flagellar motor protein MotB [Sandaracinaceae bacterium LLY-WYZ-13_1]
MLDLDGGDEEEVEEGAPAWMATFSDMATLLLTFFVLLLSFANMDIVQFRTMMGSVREAFGVQHESPGDFQARADTPISVAPGGSPSNPSVLPNAPTMARLREELNERGLETVVEVEATERGVALRIRDAVLFGSGSADLLPEARPLLAQIAELSTEFTRELSIEGHTDDRPISTVRFPSNWELSAARATAVLRFLSETGEAPESMSIAGYADTRPVADNDSVEGRARNRRVEFVFVQPTEPASPRAQAAAERPEGADEAGAAEGGAREGDEAEGTARAGRAPEGETEDASG